MEYDDIIVGGGSSGAVIAARLSEDTDRKVLLLESGQYYPGIEQTPVELLNHDEPVIRGYNWNVDGYIKESSTLEVLSDASKSLKVANSRFSMVKTAVKSTLAGGSVVGRFDYPVGRVMGGSSSVNGALALRASPDDFSEWVKAGNSNWSWDHVLPYYKKLECDYDFKDSYHGNSGPLPVRHTRPDQFTKTQRCFYDICREYHFPEAKDFNAPNATGVGSFPKNIDEQGRRISSSLAYLAPLHGRRENLTIVPLAQVNQILFDGKRATGVTAQVRGQILHYRSKRVILAAGFIHSPAILMRSGVGCESDLKALKITVRVNLPGVGKNLHDHPVASLWAVPKDKVCPVGENTHQASLRFTSKQSISGDDMSLYMLTAFNIAELPVLRDLLNSSIAMSLSAVLGTPTSRGRLQMLSAEPSVSPKVYANLLQTPEDMERMVEGVRLAWRIMQHADMQAMIVRIPVWHQKMIDNDQSLKRLLATFVRGSAHAGGTLKMGSDTDRQAVVDEWGKVYGCENLWVVDASIMPETVRTSTNLTCMMMAEKLSEHIASRG